MHPRYFIGLTLPEPISRNIAAVQADHHQPGQTMQPLVPHITLLPPSVMMSLSPDYIVPQLRAAAAEYLPLSIRLRGVGVFDKRVAHLVVECPELIELQHLLQDCLPDRVKSQLIGGRPFIPHVTLLQARPKQSLPDKVIDSLRTTADRLVPYSFVADKLAEFYQVRPRTYEVRVA